MHSMNAASLEPRIPAPIGWRDLNLELSVTKVNGRCI
jgi:hypothetical protein